MSETNGCNDCAELRERLSKAEGQLDEAKHRIADLLKVGNIKGKNRLLVEQQVEMRKLIRQNAMLLQGARRATALADALSISRAQWIHSVNAAQCMKALGEASDAIEAQLIANKALAPEVT